MQGEFSRMDRINAELSRNIAFIIQSKVKDPRLGMVVINSCKVACDLSNAKIYVSFVDYDSAQELKIKLLNKANGFIRCCLAKTTKLRIIPKLHFIYDKLNDKNLKMQNLLDKVKKDMDE